MIPIFKSLKLSKSDPTPLYIQLSSELTRLIQSGALANATKLPSIRVLSKTLKINPDTVIRAYKVLEQEGLVKSCVGKGTYVLSETPLPISERTSSNPLTCSAVQFSNTHFSSEICVEIGTQLLQTEGWDAFTDPLHREKRLLKQSICKFLFSLNIYAEPFQVHLIEDYYEFLRKLCESPKTFHIVIEQPRDLTCIAFLSTLNVVLHPITLSPDGLNLEALEALLKVQAIDYIMLQTNSQNPTGYTYSKACQEKLCSLAKAYDFYILEDGTFSEFHHQASPLSWLYHSIPKHTFFIYHFSSVYLPHLKYSFVVMPNDFLETFRDSSSCNFNHHFLQDYLNSLCFKKLRQKLLSESYLKYTSFQPFLKSPCFKKHFKPVASTSLLYFWLVPYKALKAYANLFLQHQILVAPGSLFNLYGTTDCLRISLSMLDVEEMNKLLELLVASLEVAL